MKRKFHSAFVLMALLLAGCQKESAVSNSSDINEILLQKNGNSGGCRMTMYDFYDGIGDFHNIDYITYNNGLVDEWTAFYGQVYKMEYGAGNKLIKAKVYDGNVLVYTIGFVYQNSRIVKEIWYAGSTAVIDDEVTNTYNNKGHIIKSQSIALDYIINYSYNSSSEVISWDYLIGGVLAISGHYSYQHNYKNPFRSATGIEYAFMYANGAFISASHNWYSSEKVTFYDAAGVPSVYYDLDPAKTTWQVGSQHYPSLANYSDESNSVNIVTTFSYENCKPGEKNSLSRIPKKTSTRSIKTKYIPHEDAYRAFIKTRD